MLPCHLKPCRPRARRSGPRSRTSRYLRLSHQTIERRRDRSPARILLRRKTERRASLDRPEHGRCGLWMVHGIRRMRQKRLAGERTIDVELDVDVDCEWRRGWLQAAPDLV